MRCGLVGGFEGTVYVLAGALRDSALSSQVELPITPWSDVHSVALSRDGIIGDVALACIEHACVPSAAAGL